MSDRNQGRKKLADDEETIRINATVTESQRQKFLQLGGSRWLRDMIDAAEVGCK